MDYWMVVGDSVRAVLVGLIVYIALLALVFTIVSWICVYENRRQIRREPDNNMAGESARLGAILLFLAFVVLLARAFVPPSVPPQRATAKIEQPISSIPSSWIMGVWFRLGSDWEWNVYDPTNGTLIVGNCDKEGDGE